ncbi:hypothetical protein Acr_05g0014120 [Actinidia rufa]|uniref:Late embryogenesis abundant (LEA) hydroxyproline-rich glycoprotein family n=1 Tax=Actinidia rufa TaxID=165716 RepID=A0A7J0EMR6_9ERIC|nr:hypothetical protein Acr_05g0014120 [Actinidia rufa]
MIRWQSDQVQSAERYPPFRRTIPMSNLKPPKTRSCLCRCLCWILSLLTLLLLIVGIIAAIIYFVFQPKIPKYSIDGLKITEFNLSNDMSLSATFNVNNITARNPNKKIGHRNTTVLDVALTGQTQNATDLLQSLQAQQQTGSIPLRLRARVPVRIKLGSLKLMKWKFLVRCNLVVDSLTANNVIRISSSKCKFRFRL